MDPIPEQSPLRVVVCGSFHKDPARLRDAVTALRSRGATILSPDTVSWTSEVDGFVFAAGQEDSSPHLIELRHLTFIESADLVWLHAPAGYVGLSGSMEIGYATAWGVPVYSDQIPSDITLRDFVNVVNSPAAALATATASPSLNYLSHVHQGVYDEVASEYDDRTTALEPVTQAAITELSEWLPTGASVLDVGCGAGLAVRVLAEAGFDAEGIDLSPEMVSYAKARNPDRRILTGDLLHTDLHRDYDAVLAFAFIHLFPKKDAPRVLARIWSILRPGGLLYIGTTDAEQSSEGFEGKGDYPDQPVRWRSHYTGDEMLSLLVASGYRVVATITHIDAFDKRWFDVIAARD